MTKSTNSKNIVTFQNIPLSVVTGLLGMLLMILATPLAQGQTTISFAQPMQSRIFAGASFSGVYTNNQFRIVASGGGNPVDIHFLGAPSGATFTLNPPANTNGFIGSITLAYSLAVTNVTKGVYPITIRASNTVSTATFDASLTLIVGHLYTATTPGSESWATGGNWSTGVAPANGDSVMFQDGSIRTNYLGTSLTLDSLSYIRTISGTNHDTILGPGVTLAIVGTNGFAVNVDSIAGTSKTMDVTIGGSGATLLVSNQTANFALNAVNGGGTGLRMFMTNLDNFISDVSRFGIGDVTLAQQGGIGANIMNVALAKTNVIKASFVGDYSVTNSIPFAVSLYNNGDSFNNGSANTVNLGLSNAIFADSMAVVQARSGSANNTLRFNPVLLSPKPSLLVRGIGGGRMSLFAIATDSGITAPGSNSRGRADLRGGKVDIQVDEMWVGRTRYTNTSAVVNQGFLFMDDGILDANKIRVGYAAYTNDSVVQSEMTVGSNAVVVINDELELGHTEGDYIGGIVGNNRGRLFINSGGVVRANKITTGTQSTNNSITMTAGGALIVSNSIGTPSRYLTTLDMANSILAVPVSTTSTNAYVTNLVMGGSGNTIKILSTDGITTYPTQVPVISWVTRTPSSQNFKTDVSALPAGFNAIVSDNLANQTIDVIITTNPPNTLFWRGYSNAVWNTSEKNWLEPVSGNATNFVNGDNVIFDDTPGVPTTVTLDGTVTPSQSSLIPGIAITNSVNNFTFTGSGGILGSAQLVKAGSGTLTLDNYGEYSILHSQGLLLMTANGNAGSVAVVSGATLQALGNVSGGLTSSGVVTNGGTISGGADLNAGVLTNAGTINGNLAVQGATILHNLETGILNDFGSPTFPTNSLLINDGKLTGNALTIAGTFKNQSAQDITLSTTLSIGNRATFIPDGDGIGTARVVGQGADVNAGRVLFQSGSTNIFKVDLATANTLLLANRHSFGPNQLSKAFNGGTVVITNVGATPFSAGQSLKLFGNTINAGNIFDAGLNTTNSYPVIEPTTPGAGLYWDLSNLWIPDGNGNNGLIHIRSVATTPTNVVASYSLLTTVSTNIPPVTNQFVLSTLTWPEDYTGWKLETQQNPLTIGLSTNWSQVFESAFTNSVIVTNQYTTNCVFFRLVYP